MRVGAGIVVPIILCYAIWAYWVFRGKVDEAGYHSPAARFLVETAGLVCRHLGGQRGRARPGGVPDPPVDRGRLMRRPVAATFTLAALVMTAPAHAEELWVGVYALDVTPI